MTDAVCELPELTPSGRLPVGRHPAGLKDVRIRFVDQAPFREKRERIFAALELYAENVWSLLPTAKLWLDGGFVTHKSWEPKDVDVVILARPSEAGLLEEDQLLPFLTLPGPGGTKIQPMGGLVDGFLVLRGNANEIPYWQDFWATVVDQDKNVVEGARKGYVEVSSSE